VVELAARIRELDFGENGLVPFPGGGRTPARHRALAELGRQDLSLARIAEAHSDALAIFAEAGRAARAGELYGVWASDGAQSRVTAAQTVDGRWRLEGTKQYCSGAPFVTSALVTAHGDQGLLLFDVPLHDPAIRLLPSSWSSPAMADTATGPVGFDGITVTADALVGCADWYLSRPGFWHGALGPAACWAGGAQFLVEAACAQPLGDAHSRAHRGALLAAAWGLAAVLDQAGREIDADPGDALALARPRALKVRHLVERWCTEVLDRFGRATGPRLLCFDAQVARQYMALTVYIRQCHAERDLETI
jgi:hypothetical protein